MPSQEEIEQQQELLTTHRHTLAHLLKQVAQFSAGYVPAHVANGIAEARANIQRIKQILHGYGISTDEHHDDEPENRISGKPVAYQYIPGVDLNFENAQFLSKKLEILHHLHSALIDWYFTLNLYGNVPPSTLQEFKETITPKEEVFLRAKAIAEIYLDDNERKCMSSVLGAFRQASMAIFLSLPDDQCPANKQSYELSVRRLDWGRFTETYQEGIECLIKLLNPDKRTIS